MTRAFARFGLAVFLIGLACIAGLARASMYEAELPPRLASDPDLCAYVPCKELMPEADGFSPRKGAPPYAEAWRTVDGQRRLAGFVFLSTDVVDIPAYSGKPVVTLIAMDPQGKILGVRILKHSEPILLLGIPESALTKFVAQYAGRFAKDKVEVGRARQGDDEYGVDAISGATVTVIAENQAIMRSAYEVAREVGIVKAVVKPQAKFTSISDQADWDALVKEHGVERLTVQPSDLDLPASSEPYVDLWFGDLDAPNVGRNVLGEHAYDSLRRELKPGEHAIFIAGNGTASFKGSAFVRGGIFDRIQVAQDGERYTFRDSDYRNLYAVAAPGAPRFRESGIFILRGASFSAAYPWRLVFLANKRDAATGAKTFVNFEREYWLPARYLEGGRPQLTTEDAVWAGVWKAKTGEIALFAALLAFTAGLYALRDRVVRRATRKDMRWVNYPRYAIYVASVAFVGFFAMAQPSITQVLTWFHSVFYQWRWELFLSDPLIFIFWWFIVVTVFVWGRGLFCGWLCPYGAFSELSHKLAGALGLRRFQFQLPPRWHNRLKWVKYAIFATLVGASFYSMGTAEKMAEVEPFKSTFLVAGVWHRTWPFIAYWAALFVASLFVERPFCKYVCPLGAGLAIPSTFTFLRLRRKSECTSCHACQTQCSSQAIDDKGRIDERECLLCQGCQVLYHDDHACPPLAHERKRRTKAGLPLTPIGRDGYFIPIREVKGVPAAAPRPSAVERHGPTERVSDGERTEVE